jgi:hypothetical protein
LQYNYPRRRITSEHKQRKESKLIKLLEGGIIIIPQKQKQQYTKNENTK